MVKLLTISDTHEIDIQPSKGITGAAQKIARYVDADAIIAHGDYLEGVWCRRVGEEQMFDRMRKDPRILPLEQLEKEYVTALDNLTAGDIPVYAIGGNHCGITNIGSDGRYRHEPFFMKLLEEHPKIRSLEKKRDSFKGLELGGVGGHREIMSGGATPIEYTEDQFRSFLEPLKGVDYLVTHTPPHRTLDTVPYNPRFESEAEPPVFGSDGKTKIGLSVGSKAIREFVDGQQPRYATHGHIHESTGVAKLGPTMLMNCAWEGNHVVGLINTESNKAGLIKIG